MIALLAANVLWAIEASTVRQVSWSFEIGDEGWRVGVSPVSFFTGDAGSEKVRAPDVVDGALVVRGSPTERLFVDADGLVRRGVALVQWLLSPAIGAEASDLERLTLRLRAVSGAQITWKLQWLTQDAKVAFGNLHNERRSLALPDSVRSVAARYRQGRISERAWRQFMAAWEAGEGHDYAQTTKRLGDEEILLLGWVETEARRFVGTGEWQELAVDLSPLAGWRGSVVGFGLEFIQQPTAPDALLEESSQSAAPFVWVDQVDLVGATGPPDN
jgi:hypothetical protein